MTEISSDFNLSDQRKAISNRDFAAHVFGVSAATGTLVYVFSEQPAEAAPSPEVVATVQTALDTIPILSGLCMAVFAAGLAPWAARTALSWMSSIMKGAI